MFKIVGKEVLAPTITLLEIEAWRVARKAAAGQFAIFRAHERGERIPFTIADRDLERGTITIVFQRVGKSTALLSRMEPGDALLDVVGPLGVPSEVRDFGQVACIAGGVGIAYVYPEAAALREAGNRIISILGARTKELLFFEDRMRALSDRLIVTTDDGSCGRKALVTQPLRELLEGGEQVDRVIATGPVPMMKAVSELTRPYSIPTMVSLNPIMVDGTGMCGACRVTVGGETKFTCVDGPNFDGHLVDFDELRRRQSMFVECERECAEQEESAAGTPARS